ncbi:MAG TPA: HEAT repeat domain-containing protein, partial [Gemmata sp.]
MNDEAAFIAAIAAAPDDAHLPLVFADWLDDRDDPRGQWIRAPHVHQWMRPTYESPVPKLLASLERDARVLDVRRAAEVIGGPIVPGLVDLLKHETPRVRQQACMCLRHIGKRAHGAAPALLAALGDPDYSVREQAAKALRDIGPAGVTDTKPLKAALTDASWSVRGVASRVLGSMKAKGSVLQELTEKFDSPDPGDRAEVVEGLAQLGTADAVPVLDRALGDPVAEVREKAVCALGRLKFATVVAPLCRATRDRLARVRGVAVRQFGSHRWEQPLTAAVVAALTERLGDRVPEVRAAACGPLAR